MKKQIILILITGPLFATSAAQADGKACAQVYKYPRISTKVPVKNNGRPNILDALSKDKSAELAASQAAENIDAKAPISLVQKLKAFRDRYLPYFKNRDQREALIQQFEAELRVSAFKTAEELAKKKENYYDAIFVGAGPQNIVALAKFMEENPNARVLMVDQTDTAGSNFRYLGEALTINSSNRASGPGRLALPGEGNINELPGLPIQISEFTAVKYPTGNDLASSIIAGLYSNIRNHPRVDIALRTEVLDILTTAGEKNPSYSTGVRLKLANGQETTARALVTDAGTGLGREKITEEVKRAIIANPKLVVAQEGETIPQLTVSSDFLTKISQGKAALDAVKGKTLILAGDGDSAYIVLESLLGYMVAAGYGTSTAQTIGPKRILWLNQSAENCKQFIEKARSRYAPIGTGFRNSNMNLEALIKPFKQKLANVSESSGNLIGVELADGNKVNGDHAILAIGYEGQNRTLFSEGQGFKDDKSFYEKAFDFVTGRTTVSNGALTNIGATLKSNPNVFITGPSVRLPKENELFGVLQNFVSLFNNAPRSQALGEAMAKRVKELKKNMSQQEMRSANVSPNRVIEVEAKNKGSVLITNLSEKRAVGNYSKPLLLSFFKTAAYRMALKDTGEGMPRSLEIIIGLSADKKNLIMDYQGSQVDIPRLAEVLASTRDFFNLSREFLLANQGSKISIRVPVQKKFLVADEATLEFDNSAKLRKPTTTMENPGFKNTLQTIVEKAKAESGNSTSATVADSAVPGTTAANGLSSLTKIVIPNDLYSMPILSRQAGILGRLAVDRASQRAVVYNRDQNLVFLYDLRAKSETSSQFFEIVSSDKILINEGDALQLVDFGRNDITRIVPQQRFSEQRTFNYRSAQSIAEGKYILAKLTDNTLELLNSTNLGLIRSVQPSFAAKREDVIQVAEIPSQNKLVIYRESTSTKTANLRVIDLVDTSRVDVTIELESPLSSKLGDRVSVSDQRVDILVGQAIYSIARNGKITSSATGGEQGTFEIKRLKNFDSGVPKEGSGPQLSARETAFNGLKAQGLLTDNTKVSDVIRLETGKVVYFAGSENTVKIYDPTTGTSSEVISQRLPNGKVVGVDKSNIFLLDFVSGTAVARYSASPIKEIDFVGQGEVIALKSEVNGLLLFTKELERLPNTDSVVLDASLLQLFNPRIYDLADKNYIVVLDQASVNEGTKLIVIDYMQGKLIKNIVAKAEVPLNPTSIRFSENGGSVTFYVKGKNSSQFYTITPDGYGRNGPVLETPFQRAPLFGGSENRAILTGQKGDVSRLNLGIQLPGVRPAPSLRYTEIGDGKFYLEKRLTGDYVITPKDSSKAEFKILRGGGFNKDVEVSFFEQNGELAILEVGRTRSEGAQVTIVDLREFKVIRRVSSSDIIRSGIISFGVIPNNGVRLITKDLTYSSASVFYDYRPGRAGTRQVYVVPLDTRGFRRLPDLNISKQEILASGKPVPFSIPGIGLNGGQGILMSEGRIAIYNKNTKNFEVYDLETEKLLTLAPYRFEGDSIRELISLNGDKVLFVGKKKMEVFDLNKRTIDSFSADQGADLTGNVYLIAGGKKILAFKEDLSYVVLDPANLKSDKAATFAGVEKLNLKRDYKSPIVYELKGDKKVVLIYPKIDGKGSQVFVSLYGESGTVQPLVSVSTNGILPDNPTRIQVDQNAIFFKAGRKYSALYYTGTYEPGNAPSVVKDYNITEPTRLDKAALIEVTPGKDVVEVKSPDGAFFLISIRTSLGTNYYVSDRRGNRNLTLDINANRRSLRDVQFSEDNSYLTYTIEGQGTFIYPLQGLTR